MRVRKVLLAVTIAVSLGTTAACSAVQESLECPGEDCPESLRAVAEQSADVPEVTAVDRAWRFYTIDRGHSGGVDVHAGVTTEREARTVAAAIATIYRDSDVEAVERVSVRVVPEPETSEPDTQESTLGTGPSESSDVPCATEGCAKQVADFEQAFADDASAGEATLGEVSWVADDYRPYTSIEVTAPDTVMDAEAFEDFRGHILDLAQDAGLGEIGQVRTVIHFQRRLEFSFDFDGNRTE